MNEKFDKLGPNRVSSVEGFTVALDIMGGVEYSDATGTRNVDSETLNTWPYSIALYTESMGLKGMPASRVEQILSNITEALEYLGYAVKRF
jgi:hypothetical protein